MISPLNSTHSAPLMMVSSALGLFRRPLPAFERHLLAAGQRELAVRRVLGERAARAGGGITANAQRRHQHVARPDEGAIFDGGLPLVRTVVVASDGAGADV